MRGPDDDVTRSALRARTGDQTAVEEFVRATQRDVWQFVAHLTDSSSADDLAQETYLRALAVLPRFTGRASARFWLLSIARQVAIDHAHQASRQPESAAVNWSHTENHADPSALTELNDLLQQLAQDRREALVATQVLGLTYTEAAQVCGCPVGTIRSRVARAREDLIRALNGQASEVTEVV